ncbi:hypothetical protein B0H13DRAFT_2561693 [Mycena leptocephala]|nr:hypothetical protein B0H13DRAFT_2561693 [Mycena leptocephala]
MAQDRRIFTQISERVKIQTIAEYNEYFARLSKRAPGIREHKEVLDQGGIEGIESNAAVDGTGTGAHLALEVRDTKISSILAFDGTAKRAHLALTQGGSSGEMNIEAHLDLAQGGSQNRNECSLRWHRERSTNRNEPALRLGQKRRNLTADERGNCTWFSLKSALSSSRWKSTRNELAFGDKEKGTPGLLAQYWIKTNLAFDGTGKGTHLALAQGESRVETNLTFNGARMEHTWLSIAQGGSRLEMNWPSGTRKVTHLTVNNTSRGNTPGFPQLDVGLNESGLRWRRKRNTLGSRSRWKSNQNESGLRWHSGYQYGTYLALAQGGSQIKTNLICDGTANMEDTWLSLKVQVESKRMRPSMTQGEETHLALDSSRWKSNAAFDGAGRRDTLGSR